MATLTAELRAALEAGDTAAAQVAHEALGKLLGGTPAAAVVDLAAERLRRQ